MSPVFAGITEVSDGVTFTILSTNNLVGGNRILGSGGTMSNGLHVGGGGGSTLQFTISADMDVNLQSYGLSSGGFFLGTPTLDVLTSTGNALTPQGATVNFAGGPIALSAGTAVTFDVQNTGAAVQSFIGSFDFEKATTAPVVPLPAGMPLMLAGLAAFAWVRRKA